MLAYLLLTVKSGFEQKVYNKIKNLENVKNIHILFGEWDIITLLDLESPEHLAGFVMENIRNLEGIKLSSTMIVAQ